MSFPIIIQCQGGTCSQPATNDAIITRDYIYELFALRRSKKIPTSQYSISKLSLCLFVVCSLPSPCNGVGPTGWWLLRQLIADSQGKWRWDQKKLFAYQSHYPANPANIHHLPASLSSQSWRKLDFRWEIIKLTEMTERWLRVHVVGAGWWVVPGEAAR